MFLFSFLKTLQEAKTNNLLWKNESFKILNTALAVGYMFQLKMFL